MPFWTGLHRIELEAILLTFWVLLSLMSSTAPTKGDRPANTPPSGKGLLDWAQTMLTTSVGGKVLVAITGLALTLFVIAHLLGNLLLLAGPEAINAYAAMLKGNKEILWAMRLGLLAVFVIHIVFSLGLNLRSRKARPVGYAYERTVQASVASRTMVLTGLVIFAFVLYHLAHYTLGIAGGATVDGKTVNFLELHDPADLHKHDVYRMVVYGFRNPVVAAIYIVAQVLLILHLSHGVASALQTLGLNVPRSQRAFTRLGWAIALFVGGGNILLVLAVLTRLVGADVP